ncbi:MULTISPECIES: hypothetical protein [unclassified Amycolatopsis]|uniref:hypothetical protein n=1 Tax=unclassified Amycolatopsis TaxID=2618356 RepID=UPI001F0F75E9|nr:MULTISPECIES: hypothetical protein [unclassified Amycolatopsis]
MTASNPNGIWLGTLQRDSYPAGVAAVGPGRLALTATDPYTFRDAVEDLLTAWEDDGHGAAIRPEHRHDTPPCYADYAYVFDRGQVWIHHPSGRSWLRATDHPDVKAALTRK